MRPYNLAQLWQKYISKRAVLPALRYPDQTITYGMLDQYSDRFAFFLHAHGLAKGDVVAIGHEKRPLAYAMMLACIKIGCPYVVLDSASPADRLERIIATSAPKLLFYDDSSYAATFDSLCAKTGLRNFLLEENLLPANGWSEDPGAFDGQTIAYIMFTSGSTGQPKGVAVTHQNILPFISWGASSFEITDADIFANLSPMYFDNSVFDFYTALFTGASLAPVTRPLLREPYDLVRHVGAMGCTIWFSVPSLLIYLMTMKALRPPILSSLRSISFGGEGYPKPELKKLYDLFSPQARLVNVYGPTETTCICSSWKITDEDFRDLEGLPPLGHLNPNFDFLILDEAGRNADEGELVLVGPNVSAGYFNDPERTKKSFFTLLDSSHYGKRAYRTGDIVKQDADGLLRFAGRRDNQIKHMGYRIELEEIEHGILRIPGISQACAIYQRQNSAFGKIFAFAAYSGNSEEAELLKELGRFLPAYMIPSHLCLLPDLPKNANGKVDRQALKQMLA